MSHHLTPEMMKKFSEWMHNPCELTEEEKAKMDEASKKFMALSPEERKKLREMGDD